MLFYAIPDTSIRYFKKILSTGALTNNHSVRLGVDSKLYIFDIVRLRAIACTQKNMKVYDFYIYTLENVEYILIIYEDADYPNNLVIASYLLSNEMLRFQSLIFKMKKFVSACLTRDKIFLLIEKVPQLYEAIILSYPSPGKIKRYEIPPLLYPSPKIAISESLTSIGYITSEQEEFIVVGTALSGCLFFLKETAEGLLDFVKKIQVNGDNHIKTIYTFSNNKIGFTTGKNNFFLMRYHKNDIRLEEYPTLTGAQSIQIYQEWLIFSNFIRFLSVQTAKKIIILNMEFESYAQIANQFSLLTGHHSICFLCSVTQNGKMLKVHCEDYMENRLYLLESEEKVKFTQQMRSLEQLEPEITIVYCEEEEV